MRRDVPPYEGGAPPYEEGDVPPYKVISGSVKSHDAEKGPLV